MTTCSRSTVPARIRDADDRLVAELAIVENLQRKDLNPIETARAFQRLLEEHGHTQESVAQRVGKDRSTVANAMRLLKLPRVVRLRDITSTPCRQPLLTGLMILTPSPTP